MLKQALDTLAAALLLLNGIGALYGGINLILHPDGSSIKLSPHWLLHSPFSNYFIPGIILFVANGILSMSAFTALIMQLKNYTYFVLAQGAILTGWIIIQMYLIQTIHPLHIILGCMGLILVIVGIILSKNKLT
jgi:hypothetical protein